MDRLHLIEFLSNNTLPCNRRWMQSWFTTYIVVRFYSSRLLKDFFVSLKSTILWRTNNRTCFLTAFYYTSVLMTASGKMTTSNHRGWHDSQPIWKTWVSIYHKPDHMNIFPTTKVYVWSSSNVLVVDRAPGSGRWSPKQEQRGAQWVAPTPGEIA